MAASENALSKLHEMLAALFTQDIQICMDEGIPMSASDKAVIVKFLKDNNITAVPTSEDMTQLNNAFNDMVDELATRRKARANLALPSDDEGDSALQALM